MVEISILIENLKSYEKCCAHSSYLVEVFHLEVRCFLDTVV